MIMIMNDKDKDNVLLFKKDSKESITKVRKQLGEINNVVRPEILDSLRENKNKRKEIREKIKTALIELAEITNLYPDS